MTKILYVFDSVFQTNVKIAKQAEELLKSLGIDYRIRRVERVSGEVSELSFIANEAPILDYQLVTKNDMEWADGYIVASPIHSGMISAAIKFFFDSFHEEAASGAYVNKTFTAIVTGGLPHGGTEKTLEQLYFIALQWGCLVIPPSLSAETENPYGTSFIINEEQVYQQERIDSSLSQMLEHFCSQTNVLAAINQEKIVLETKPVEAFTIGNILKS